MNVLNPLVFALFLSVALGSAATIFAWRQRPEPGATPLVVLLLAQSWWSTSIIFKLQASTIEATTFWIDASALGVVAIPVAWLLFALEYSGHDKYIRPQLVGLLLIIPVLTIVLIFTNSFHDLIYVQAQGIAQDGSIRLTQAGPWVWVLAGYTYLLGILGIIPLLALLTNPAGTFRNQSLTLLVGILTPWVTNIIFLSGAFPNPAIDPTPIAFSVSGVAYLTAITRHRLLGTSPAPTQRARKHLFDQMHMGAIVVDSNGYLVDMNDTFVDIFGIGESALGTLASETVPYFDSFPDEGSHEGYLSPDEGLEGRSYDVTVTPISNDRGHHLGRVITFHDISEHLRQQQRLEVLNRIFRHNIRTETNIIYGYAERLGGEETHVIEDRAMRIAEFGEKSREAIKLFDEAHGGTNTTQLSTLLEQSISEVREDWAFEDDVDLPAEAVSVTTALKPVLVNLIENAAEHNPSDDAFVHVTARTDGEDVRIDVIDNGPGISDYEIAPLEEGTETALKHGSGLGLWIVKWGVDIANGTIRFRPNDPTGTIVSVTVPRPDVL